MTKLMKDILNDLNAGKMVIVTDDQDRENEGDFVMLAEKAKPEDINFMMREGRGLICVPFTTERAHELGLTPMVHNNTALHETAFTVSVDAVNNTTTGISAKDRWQTLQVILDPAAKPTDLGRPGHLFPLVAKAGGVLLRAGHTEASVDLARLAQAGRQDAQPIALLVEIVDEDGTMARGERLKAIANQFDLKIISVTEIIAYRRRKEKLVERLTSLDFPTKFGQFELVVYQDTIHHDTHLALVRGVLTEDKPVLVRVHSQCLTGDIFGSLRCDCGSQMERALERIDEEGQGVLVYLRQEGRGIGLKNKLLAYGLQDEGLDTVEANQSLGFKPDLREYGIGAQILRDLGVRKLRLLTNNPRKLVGLDGYGLEITDREPIEIPANVNNRAYLETKRDKLGHLILQ
ncbi:MAG: bifunctional 3,4-dihydroxy-2-butanone-4-phosphate synthase/GTP cyclohydrolase II [Candidatus Marinimicrobia bacterium]|nr:bifunctional 3,4-dihydroxy-2-butanone-4-phosphate synthase/GTP cyclohydrolase II [Candidatus Neomarinimicrobiota bacterium]